jgi:cbb3-type cytochrome oxidase subunit 3
MRQYTSSLAVMVLVCVADAGITASTARAEGSRVVITGGADETEHNYTWNVTNRSTSRIVRIELPHFAASLFSAPDNWKQGTPAEMNLVRLGWNSNPGLCWTEPTAGNPGVGPGMTAVFSMQIAAVGALRAPGTVTVKFADGTQVQVAGVQLPTQPVKTSPWTALFGMGLIFVLFIVYRERSKRKQAASTALADDDSDQPVDAGA